MTPKIACRRPKADGRTTAALATPAVLLAAVEKAAEKHRPDVIDLLQRLIRIPSVNHPPHGDEKAVQQWYARYLRKLGLPTDLFEAADVPEFENHPGRLRDHDMTGRPDVVATLKGSGSGRSLMLLAHSDVEATGDPARWTGGNPFSGDLRNGRIYGRGSGDDKAGMAIARIIPRILKSAGIRLKGDLIIGSTSDEEQGGSNGAIAILAKGYRADATLYLDGCNQVISTSNLGGGSVVVELRVPAPQADATSLLEYFDALRKHIKVFQRDRAREFAAHRHYSVGDYRFRALRFLDIRMAAEDVAQGSFKIWFYLLPHEDPVAFQKRFARFLRSIKHDAGRLQLRWMPRFILASEVDEDHALVSVMRRSFTRAARRPPEVAGAPMCDMGFVNAFGGYPCLMFSPARWGKPGMVHQVDEFVEAKDIMECLKTVLFCTLEWCGCEGI